jgi:endonuclease YncB( thermonuclease family)
VVPVDEFTTMQLAYVDRLKKAITPAVNAYAENMQSLATKHAGDDPAAAGDYTAEARRAAQLLEAPQDLFSSPAKGPRPNADGFRELRDVTFVASPHNTGDRFKVRQGEEEFFVRLLWVSCPPVTPNEGKPLKEYAAYFGISAEDALAIGQRAQEFTARFLAGKPLVLLTRGTKDDDDSLLVGVRPGKVGDFAGVLVDNGLAMIKPATGKKGPAREHEESILRNLAEREKAAKTRAIPPGAWARRNDQ